MPKLMCMTRLDESPLDIEDRISVSKQAGGIGYCNITKCCTKVCPENITITDNAIIPLKERVVDEFYDPLRSLLKLFRPNTQKEKTHVRTEATFQRSHSGGTGQSLTLPFAQ